MFENDYLMRMIQQLVEAIVRAIRKQFPSDKEAITAIESDIGRVCDTDHNLLLSMQPDSMLNFLQLGSFNKGSAEYVARSLYYVGDLYRNEGENDLYQLRYDQANKLVAQYDLGIDQQSATPEQLLEFLEPDDSSTKPTEK